MENDLKEKRELDIWFARQMGLKYLGWAWCMSNPENDEWLSISSKNKHGDYIEQPVYLEKCFCDIIGKSNAERREIPEVKKLLEQNPTLLDENEEKICGHYNHCLKVIPYYHDNFFWISQICDFFIEKPEFSEMLNKMLTEKYTFIEVLVAEPIEILKIVKLTMEKINGKR